jgi:hypothetical protein
MNIKSLLETLENRVLLEQKETFKQGELTPVIINPPTGTPSPLPPQQGGKQIDVEVIDTGKPPPSKGAGASKPGETSGKETKKTDKPGEGEKKAAASPTIDSHEIFNKSDPSEAKEMAEKILEKAEAERKERGEDLEKSAGEGAGNFMDKLRDIHKPRINWSVELKRKLTEFKSRTSTAINRYSKKKAEKYKEGEGVVKSKAYHQWLRDPRSHGGSKILFKGPYVKAPIGEVILIVALDTSGSIPESTIGKVFAEMDKIATNFKRGLTHGGVSMEGKVYFMTWDSAVASVDEYKPGEWRKYKEGTKKIKGGGGTDPSSIFDYLKKHTLFDREKPTAALLNILKEPAPTGMSKHDIVIPVKGGSESPSAVMSPFLLIATDGFFFGKVNDADLGLLYKDNEKNILYLVIDGQTQDCYPKNVIVYESVRA